MNPLGDCNLALLAEQAFERRGDYESLLFEGRWHLASLRGRREAVPQSRESNYAGALVDAEPGDS